MLVTTIFSQSRQEIIVPPQETPPKESPDPINVLISIIKPGWKRVLFLILPAIGLIIAHFICYSDSPSTRINIIRLCLTIITVIYIGVSIDEAYKKKSDIVDSFQKNQPQFFTIIVILGGTLAILIPMIMNVTKLIGDGAPLTTALLGITGGIIAIFGYYKTHQKSELEREQLDTQKQKDARDHIRQLHDSYNDRFDKAVAELNSNDVKSAYAAVPKLAKLADAWLDYKDLSNDTEELEKLKKKAEKEAQTIINILCKYIRTMPGEYTEEDLKDIGALNTTAQDKLKSESEVRRLIFSEMSDRSSKITIKNGEISTSAGRWSEFDFDFTQAPIFYPLNNLKIEKANFSYSTFYAKSSFDKTIFVEDANFNEATFTQTAHFFRAIFAHDADFRGADFSGADFSKAAFTQNANFNEATFNEAIFNEATFTHDACFWGAIFTHEAHFLITIFAQKVNFSYAFFEKYAPTFVSGDLRAQFSIYSAQEDYKFSVRNNSKTIPPGEAELAGIKRQIPFGTVLFDPMSPKNKDGNYSGLSNPAE